MHKILLTLMLAMVLVGCAPAAQDAVADAPAGSDDPEPAAGDDAPPADAAPEQSDDWIAAPPNPEVEQLFARSGQVKSYSFDAVRLPDKNAFATYSVRGDKAKVRLVQPINKPGWTADYVYVDYASRTANAYCIELAGCKKDRRIAPESFETYGITLPLQWQDQIVTGDKTKSLTFDKRPVVVVRWQADRYYEAYVDSYYGFPLRVAAATDAEMTDVVGGNEYRAIAFNNVKEEDVTPPW